ncbi:hypothetical protein BU23DRAFT_318114 [Bimuria novae-zelandiae CBS 107.79]|uniref:DUF7730 domain-containing protein n=1 Tax=Bimuria novae-zelandiae CBS 107.79 TaxID=1447943 RepID=A0A6A5VK07_9PLEO|nr:hypothetical protein BU23DRAFT_318114 [Bimuria novae-zelandiae CBS 107.79]
MIYAELFTFERVWIMLVDKRLVCDWEHLPAKQNVDKNQAIEVSSSNNPSTEPASSYAPAKSSFGIHGPMHHLSHRKFRGTWVSFLQTCRRVYSEAIPFLYSLPTFFFHDTMPFLAFAASLPPSHFKHIRSVTINLACDFAQPLFPYSLWKRWGTAKHFHMQVTRPEATSLDYAFFHDGSFAGELLNASVLPPQNSNTLLPSYMWDAIASALEEMKGLKKVHITMRDIPRQILVWCEHGYEHSGQRDALEIRSSLEWIGRDRPWKGDKNEGTENRKGKETEVVFENVWRKNDEQKRGHWIRHVGDDGKVEWEEVGEAAGRVRRDF